MPTSFELPPGAPARPDELTGRLAAAALARPGAPRTRHVQEGGAARFVNRLALETSPYLLQHAHNPVDWRPWGDEAFAEARARGVPVFLSIGYSTCHWCHVMEEESFEDLELSKLLNENYVCIKIDREERPDIDSIYMQAVQMLTSHGGWPMSVWLDTERRPFYAGTYFPPRDGDRGARVGFRTILLELARVYREERPRVDGNAAQIARGVQQALSLDAPTGLPERTVLHGALEHYAQTFDPRDGGTRRAPKFPSSLHVRFLLRAWRSENEPAALSMATFTLQKMALGGLYDQVGGGFHRYSTDAQWLVPHFEKMLYDNALLTVAYVEAWQALQGAQEVTLPTDQALTTESVAAQRALFRRIAEEVLEYVAREMTDPRGAFWSATDADSEGEEGTYFVWTPQQLKDVLGQEDAARAAALFGVTMEGNFEETGASVLSLQAIPQGADATYLARVRPLLYAARSRREPPLTDRKILTSWNGLMISAFARAGLAFARPDFVARAEKAAAYLLDTHWQTGALLRSSLDGVARHAGVLEDYAMLAAGLVDLFEATGAPRWLAAALELHEVLRARFAAEGGGYYRTGTGGEALLAREKPAYDGAEPTGNSVAALTLLRLEALTGEARHGDEARALLRSFGALLNGAPAALGEMLLAVDWLLSEPREIVLLRPAGGSDAELLSVMQSSFRPSQVLIRCEAGAAQEALGQLTALVRERPLLRGVSTAYVCVKGACGLPVTDAAGLAAQLG